MIIMSKKIRSTYDEYIAKLSHIQKKEFEEDIGSSWYQR